MNKKTTILFVALALTASTAAGRQIDENEARSIASSRVPSLATHAESVMPKGAPSTQKFAPLYMFKSPSGGFAIVAGDDRMPNLLLAYSDNTTLDINNCAPAMKAWLHEMTQFIAAGDFSHIYTPTQDYSIPVGPLITTKWDQDAPYNLLTPIGSDGEHFPTGCAATAMAQTLKYWNWPINGGIAANSYESNGQTLSVDFRESRYDWNNLTDEYNEYSTDAQNNAVAKLMFDCGVACNMQYNTEMSSTFVSNVAKGLVDFLGFNPGIRIRNRDYIADEAWFDLLNNELDSKRPILYSGVTPSQEGHSFICDGYDNSGLYHINWGWGGMCDGYFDISTLKPDIQGIGGADSEEGFALHQTIITDMRPPLEGDEPSHGWELLIDSFSIKPLDEECSQFSVEWTVNNLGFRPFAGNVLVSLTSDKDPEEKETSILCEITDEDALVPNVAFTTGISELDAADFEDGVYRFQLLAYDQNTEEEIEIALPTNSMPMRFEIKDGKIIYGGKSHLELEDFEIDECGFFCTYGNNRCSLSDLKFKVTNTSDVAFIGRLAVTVTSTDSSGEETLEQTYCITEMPQLSPGEACEIAMTIMHTARGRVKLKFGKINNSEESEEADDVVFNIEEFEFDADEEYCELGLAEVPETEEIEGIVSIKAQIGSCTGEINTEEGLAIDPESVTEREIECRIFKEETNQLAGTIKQTYRGKWNEIKTLTFTTSQALDNGNYRAELTYQTVADSDGNIIELTLGDEVEDFPGIHFQVANSTSEAETIIESAHDQSAEIYSLSGQRLRSDAISAPGCYILVNHGKREKIMVR